jgi:ABC-type arginine/histidine transport system permease subunit
MGGIKKFIEDDDFLDWFDREAINFMLSHRLDMLNTFYEAYQSEFGTHLIDEFTVFSGTPMDVQMFLAIKDMPKIPRKKKRTTLPKDFEKIFIETMNKKLKELDNDQNS